MKKINCKITTYVIIGILLLSTSIISVSSEKNEIENNKIKIILLDTIDNRITEKYVTEDIYNQIFDNYNNENNLFLSIDYIKNKLTFLNEINLISNEKLIDLNNELFKQDQINKLSIIPLNYDVLNIFNGILFRLEGQKISSIFVNVPWSKMKRLTSLWVLASSPI